ncbi:MAG: hypothetical protein KDD42_02120 [Bdellovibrionales bacterium]|nr:hypothetical protein [Bdellovibrionales bacterium]
MVRFTIRFVTILSVAMLILGCSSAQYHRQQVSAQDGTGMTVGTVQREVRVGMTGADVAAVLGSPNIVQTDEQRREVWIYDKISTERVYSTDSGGVASLILGGWPVGSGVMGGGGGGSFAQQSGAASTSQKTLTVIIKFDHQSRVRDFAYHTSRF